MRTALRAGGIHSATLKLATAKRLPPLFVTCHLSLVTFFCCAWRNKKPPFLNSGFLKFLPLLSFLNEKVFLFKIG